MLLTWWPRQFAPNPVEILGLDLRPDVAAEPGVIVGTDGAVEVQLPALANGPGNIELMSESLLGTNRIESLLVAFTCDERNLVV